MPDKWCLVWIILRANIYVPSRNPQSFNMTMVVLLYVGYTYGILISNVMTYVTVIFEESRLVWQMLVPKQWQDQKS